jgi:hypothetical protein
MRLKTFDRLATTVLKEVKPPSPDFTAKRGNEAENAVD